MLASLRSEYRPRTGEYVPSEHEFGGTGLMVSYGLAWMHLVLMDQWLVRIAAANLELSKYLAGQMFGVRDPT